VRQALRFVGTLSTRMACLPPLMELEARVHKMLGETTAFRVQGQMLELLSGTRPLAHFEAVYLR
jgi:heat shock protein HslJ